MLDSNSMPLKYETPPNVPGVITRTNVKWELVSQPPSHDLIPAGKSSSICRVCGKIFANEGTMDSNFRAAFADELAKKPRLTFREKRLLTALRDPNSTKVFKQRMEVVESYALAVLGYDPGESVDWKAASDFAKLFLQILEFAMQLFALFD